MAHSFMLLSIKMEAHRVVCVELAFHFVGVWSEQWPAMHFKVHSGLFGVKCFSVARFCCQLSMRSGWGCEHIDITDSKILESGSL